MLLANYNKICTRNLQLFYEYTDFLVEEKLCGFIMLEVNVKYVQLLRILDKL